MSSIFYAGMIPFYLANDCIPGVMGSPDWETMTNLGSDVPLSYSPDFYYASTAQGGLIWPDDFSGFQSIEATFSNFGLADDGSVNTNDYISLECRRTDTQALGGALSVTFHRYYDSGDPETWQWWIFLTDTDGSTLYYYEPTPFWAEWPYGETFKLRLESDVDGTYRVYVDDGLLFTDVVVGQAAGPSNVAIYSEVAGGITATTAYSPHIAEICIQGAP